MRRSSKNVSEKCKQDIEDTLRIFVPAYREYSSGQIRRRSFFDSLVLNVAEEMERRLERSRHAE